MTDDKRSIHDVLVEMIRHAIEQVNHAGLKSVVPQLHVSVEKKEKLDAWIQGWGRGVRIGMSSGMAMSLLTACVELSCATEITSLLGFQTAKMATPDMQRPVGYASIDAFRMPRVVPISTPSLGWETASELLLRSLLFVIFHELGHFVNGDIHYDRATFGASESFREDYAAESHVSRVNAQTHRKAMEYRADMSACISSIAPVSFLVTDTILGRARRVEQADGQEWCTHIIRGFAASAIVQGVIGQLVRTASADYPSPMLRGMMGFLSVRELLPVEGYEQFPTFGSVLKDSASWFPKAVEVTWRIMRLLGTPLTPELMDGFFRSDPSNPIFQEHEEIRPLLRAAAPVLRPFAKAAQSELGSE